MLFFDDEDRLDAINYRKISLYLVEVAKKQRAEIADLTARLERIEAMLSK